MSHLHANSGNDYKIQLSIIPEMAKNLVTKTFNALYEWVITLAGLAFFLISGITFTIVGIFLKPFLSQSLAHKVGRKCFHYSSKFFFAALDASGLVKVDFKELDKLRDERGIIITPNHPCLMDVLFVTSRLPNVVCVMKGSVLSNPLFFGIASLGGFIRSDTPTRFIQQCQQSLSDGGQLLLFPEGTRTQNETINPFKGGFSLIAQKTGAAIQPVFIEANSDFLGKQWPIWKKPSFPLVYRTTLGKRFNVEKKQDHRAFTKELQKYFKTQISKSRTTL